MPGDSRGLDCLSDVWPGKLFSCKFLANPLLLRTGWCAAADKLGFLFVHELPNAEDF